MFIELAEFLRCPADATETPCVVVPDEMAGRRIVTGTIGSPASNREYRIADGVADFRAADCTATLPEVEDRLSADVQAVGALLGIATPGGYAVCLGSAGLLASALADRTEEVHLVAVNPPDVVVSSPAISVLRGLLPLPLRASMARGVVVGREYAVAPWLADVSRILLKGLRIVVLREGVTVPQTQQLASGDGLWVGQKL